MSGAAFSDVQTFGHLKELYSEDSKYQEHIQSSLHNFIKHAQPGDVNLDGANWNIPAIFTLNESYAGINDTERLPQPGFQKGNFAKYNPKFHYAVIQATMVAATRGHGGGRAGGDRYIDETVRGTFLTFMSNADSETYGNGRGYRAAVATATPAATNFTVDFSTRLRPGMLLDWYSSDLTTKRGTVKIADAGIDRLNRTVYVDTSFGSGAVPAGAVAKDVLVVHTALDAGEPTDGRYAGGLDRVTDNSLSSYGGLSPSTWRAWTATNLDAAGANPTFMTLQDFWDALYTISGVYPNRMVFNPSWKRGYLNGFLAQRRFNTNEFATGASRLTFDPVKMGVDEKMASPSQFEMLEDKNCDPTKNYIWHYDALCVATDYHNAPHLADEDGQEFRNLLGFDSIQGYVRYWWNIITKQRNAVGTISNWATQGTVI